MPSLLVVSLLLGLTAAQTRPVVSFRFYVPEGWVDLSPNAPEANFARMPRGQLPAPQLAFYAADLDHAGDEFTENVAGVVRTGAVPVTLAELDKVAAGITDELTRQPGVAYRVLDRRIVQIGGADAGRIEAEMTVGGLTARQLTYLMVGRDQHAVVTYSTTASQLERHRPIFEAAAAATEGLVKPIGPVAAIARAGGRGALYGALGAAAAVLLGLVLRRRRAAS